jgi:DNA-binding SARP family transcriptional activator
MSGAHRAGDPRNELRLELRLLGPIEVSSGGRAVAVGGPKPRALLAVLALEAGRVVSSDRMIEVLWPAEAPDTAAHAVQVYVSQLRKALGSGTISTRAPGYVLELEPERVDVHRFVRLADEGRAALGTGDAVSAEVALRDALGLWRGTALADFTYEPFAQTEISRLEELRLVALEARVEADLALGRHAELVSELEAIVDSQPLRERPRAQLMLALYRAGRQADALAAYRAARETLVEELGIDPGPALRELEAAVLRQDESLLLPETAPAKPPMQFRRLVTILFVDVVESMALAETLDAEALGRVLHRYFETVSAVLTRHGGTVEKYAGDAVMAAFGIPASHEDDALRAARAACDIHAEVAVLNEQLEREHGIRLELRTGVESGEVVATQSDARQRLVSGEAVGVAARLADAAGAGEIVVGELAGRLIDHAAELEPLGEIAIKGKREPVRAYRLLDLAPAAPAFEGRLDAPLVGRKQELAALRKTLKHAIDGGSVRVAVVAGPPGVGKSRLAAELTRRAKRVTALWGRCLSYGEGITYWPVREAVVQAPPSAERDAVLTALGTEPPPPASELALLFRLLCEALARSKPLVVAFDDLHWAEPTFLELVEHLADRASAPILVVCLARQELFEDSPDFLEGRDNVVRLELDALSMAETDALLDGLGGSVLESSQRDLIVEAADGNPFFLEQLVAQAVEGGLAEGALPATVQALLAARLDRLGPGERAVLERAAVIGKQFGIDDVVALLEPQAAPTAEKHVQTLVARGFVRPLEGGELRFRHQLVQQAVYRAAPKRLRAELHERFTTLFEGRSPGLGDVDEFAGYHLERAFELRTELGETDDRTQRLAERAGQRLGAGGMRAFRRGDIPAATTLLVRAAKLLPRDDALRRELRCNLGILTYSAHQLEDAVALLEEVVEDARQAEDPRIEAWARIELEYIRLRTGGGRTADDLLAAAATGIPIFERLGDHRALGRAWLFAGWVHGGQRGDHAAWTDAAERALAHYRTAGWSTSTCLGELAAAMYWGPTPVDAAAARCEQLLREATTDRVGVAYLETFLGGLLAQQGDFDRARGRIEVARTTLEDLGHRASALVYCETVLGEIELLAGEAESAEGVLRGLCNRLAEAREVSTLASRASDLAKALVAQARLDEALEWTEAAERHASADDTNAQMMWRPVRAAVLARRGDLTRAEKLAREGAQMAAATDDLNRRGDAHRELGEVLRLAGREHEAAAELERAIALFGQKGNVVAAARVQSLQDDPALV